MIVKLGSPRARRMFRGRPPVRLAASVAGVACAAALISPAAAATSSRVAPAAGVRATLQQALARLVADGIPGAIALERDSGREWHAAAGVAKLRTRQPIRPSDRFRVGSITKSFISTVILQLVGEHRLRLQDPVSRWLPGLVPNGHAITVHELLNQTSGLYDYLDLPFYLKVLHHPLRSWSPLAMVRRAVAHAPLFPPGTSWSYSNTNYVLLGLIISAADHARPDQRSSDPARAVLDRIVAPLRLKKTSFPITDPRITGRHAHGYVIGAPPAWHLPAVLDTTIENPSWAWTAGGIISTLDDVADFHRVLFTGHLLAPAQRRELKTTVPVEPGLDYGLGVYRMQTPCGPAWGHDGGTPSSVIISLTSPKGVRQAVIMVNRDANTWSDKTYTDFTSAYLTAFCGKPVAAAQARHFTAASRTMLRALG